MIDNNERIRQLVEGIDQYYDFSFRFPPEKCTPVMMLVIGGIEGLAPQLTTKQAEKVHMILLNVLDAQQNQDFVRMRDCLFHMLKPLLSSFHPRTKGKKGKH